MDKKLAVSENRLTSRKFIISGRVTEAEKRGDHEEPPSIIIAGELVCRAKLYSHRFRMEVNTREGIIAPVLMRVVADTGTGSIL